ncbi:hypothetical protein M501DRAFT_568371 [Patellaria atrata CBS 101060]|uniref:Uncharacterized protein n=1 Tax=Patellaria atrata CBS 101060 TaxID=1346257 RepID=A0A9P4VU12_9PEZI|nr:hypothetical protein M501DRAFT_568371 [Patellaria atrata CBS 101060]
MGAQSSTASSPQNSIFDMSPLSQCFPTTTSNNGTNTPEMRPTYTDKPYTFYSYPLRPYQHVSTTNNKKSSEYKTKMETITVYNGLYPQPLRPNQFSIPPPPPPRSLPSNTMMTPPSTPVEGIMRPEINLYIVNVTAAHLVREKMKKLFRSYDMPTAGYDWPYPRVLLTIETPANPHPVIVICCQNSESWVWLHRHQSHCYTHAASSFHLPQGAKLGTFVEEDLVQPGWVVKDRELGREFWGVLTFTARELTSTSERRVAAAFDELRWVAWRTFFEYHDQGLENTVWWNVKEDKKTDGWVDRFKPKVMGMK